MHKQTQEISSYLLHRLQLCGAQGDSQSEEKMHSELRQFLELERLQHQHSLIDDNSESVVQFRSKKTHLRVFPLIQ
jgi:hypothetical protein